MSEQRKIIRMTAIGEAITEGVVRFLKRPGDAVAQDEPIAEVDTDKVTVELVAPEAGVVESLAVADDTTVRVDDPLYVLRTGAAAALPTPPGLPTFEAVTLRWDAGHVQARARALGEPAAEAALILTALARALAAAPTMLPRGREITTSWVDVADDGVRWVCTPLSLDVEVAGALVLARAGLPREPPGWRALLRVVRLHGGAASTGRLSRQPGLQLVIGPVRDEPVVVAGAVVVRPMATISAVNEVGGAALPGFVAVLAEQLGQV